MLDIENQSWEAIQRIFAPSAKNSAQECGDCGSGKDGKNGADGLSAYQIAVISGFVGSQQEWLASLQGLDGLPGRDGKDGKDGQPGVAGAAGADGKDGKDGVDGQQGTKGDTGAKGADGIRSVEYIERYIVQNESSMDIPITSNGIYMLKFSHSWDNGTGSVWSFLYSNGGNNAQGCYFLPGMSSGEVTTSGNNTVSNSSVKGQSAKFKYNGKAYIEFSNNNNYNSVVNVYVYRLDLSFTS